MPGKKRGRRESRLSMNTELSVLHFCRYVLHLFVTPLCTVTERQCEYGLHKKIDKGQNSNRHRNTNCELGVLASILSFM